MRCFVSFIACLLLSSSMANGQQETTAEIWGRMSRMTSSLGVARVEASKESSELELVAEQIEQIATLTNDYKAVVQEYGTYIDDDNQPAALSIMAKQMPFFEKRLRSDILLPHQSELMTNLVFADLLRKANGNLLRSISKNYAREFGLTEGQNKKLLEIDSRIKRETAEAERKFNEELARIAKTARKDAEKTLSPSQLETLKRFSTRSLR